MAVFRAAKAVGAMADLPTVHRPVAGKSLQRTGQADRMEEAHAAAAIRVAQEANRAAAAHQARVAAAPDPVAQSRSVASTI